MKRNIKFLLVLSFVAVNLTAASQTVADSVARVTNVDGMTLSVTLTPDSITIGDQATLTLTVNNVGNHTVVFPPLQQMNYGKIEETDSSEGYRDFFQCWKKPCRRLFCHRRRCGEWQCSVLPRHLVAGCGLYV